MSNLTLYFERRAYQPTWFIGDRVQGKWNRIPFVGTVGNDTVISEIEGPRVSVHLDLPIKFKCPKSGALKVLFLLTWRLSAIKPLSLC